MRPILLSPASFLQPRLITSVAATLYSPVAFRDPRNICSFNLWIPSQVLRWLTLPMHRQAIDLVYTTSPQHMGRTNSTNLSSNGGRTAPNLLGNHGTRQTASTPQPHWFLSSCDGQHTLPRPPSTNRIHQQPPHLPNPSSMHPALFRPVTSKPSCSFWSYPPSSMPLTFPSSRHMLTLSLLAQYYWDIVCEEDSG
ncbi:hypothetical protein F4604DRAFT_1285029 [Suillus subluteus]|nr:hypothetical protein F4604DRAFT_1285029 [Suillus subluteus]